MEDFKEFLTSVGVFIYDENLEINQKPWNVSLFIE